MMGNANKMKIPYRDPIPEQWTYKKIVEVLTESKLRNNSQLPLLSVTRDKGIIPQSESDKRDTSSSDKSRYKVISEGDIVYNTMRMWQGVVALSERVGIVSPAYTVLKPKPENYPKYIEYLFKSIPMIKLFHRFSQGLVNDTLNLKYENLKQIYMPVPPLPEQQKIADILTSVDNAIEKTEAIIEQTEKVKKGLMQQLLTKGIGHSKFKKTEIGEIPEEWEIRSLSDIGIWSGGGTPSKRKNNYWSKTQGTIWVSPKDMYEDVITKSEDYITVKGLQDKKLTILPKGTILFVTRSGILRNRIPIALAGKELTINQDLKALQVNSNYNNEYIFYTLQSLNEKIRKRCVKFGTTVESIEFSMLKNIKIPVPSLEEQIKIVEIMKNYYMKNSYEKRKLNNFMLIKKGLMQVLLTGKVRVKVDKQEVVNS